ncbi:MAG: glutaminyl-peptide cyclotransferase [Flavipsychrobacter sp.]|jgi:glutamine cyclotransferase|nr:glutaminyl-peptide cyclotransferase [Flavipsychrobacter sp.]
MKRPRKPNLNYLFLSGCLFLAACNGNEKPPHSTADSTAGTTSVPIPIPISFEVVKEYPHDAGAFTEGLEFRDGILYEGTGQYGHSDVRKVDLQTGKVLQSTKLEPRFFGEGITVLNGKLYQLTYREGKGFVYDAKTLKLERTFIFDAAEGWGMTNNGTHLIFDDGSNVFYFMDPNTFKVIKQLKVTDEYGPVKELNEPELIKGFIYANVWRTDMILKIDTATGHVVGRADLNMLRHTVVVPPPTGRAEGPEVLNGIAYDAVNNKIYITGKYWPKLLEVKLDN